MKNVTKLTHNELEQLNDIFIILEDIKEIVDSNLSDDRKKEKIFSDVQNCFPIMKTLSDEFGE